jgi:hypothetical protein
MVAFHDVMPFRNVAPVAGALFPLLRAIACPSMTGFQPCRTPRSLSCSQEVNHDPTGIEHLRFCGSCGRVQQQ